MSGSRSSRSASTQASDDVTDVNAVKVSARSRRAAVFGSEVLDALYQQARRVLSERRVGYLSYYPADRGPAWASLIIAGVWRVDREIVSGRLELQEWHAGREAWGNVETWNGFPSFQLMPLRQGRALSVYITAAVTMILTQLGWETPEHWEAVLRENAAKANYQWPDENVPLVARIEQMNLRRRFKPIQNEPELNKEVNQHAARLTAAKKLLISEILKNYGAQDIPGEKNERSTSATHGMIKRLWSQAVDKEVLSLVGLARMGQPVGWNDYVRYALHAPALRKVGDEHRNLIPMLERIEPKYWSRPNLFSRRRWVRDGRKGMVVETTTFCRRLETSFLPHRKACFVAFEHPAAFRWLLKASPLVVNRWLVNHNGNGAAIERCTRLNLPATTSPLIWEAILRLDERLQPRDHEVWFQGLEGLAPPERTPALAVCNAALDRAVRLYALHLIERWRTIGMHAMLKYMATGPLSNILDWISSEGGLRGLPDKNARWESMLRMSEAWHVRRQEEVVQEDRLNQQPFLYTWFCPWGEPEVINGITVTPLTTSAMLWEEGAVLEHCVGWNGYDAQCFEGRAQIFSLIDASPSEATVKKRARSTVCLKRQASTGKWVVQQNYTYHNHAPLPLFAKVGKGVAQRLNEREAAFFASGEVKPVNTSVRSVEIFGAPEDQNRH